VEDRRKLIPRPAAAAAEGGSRGGPTPSASATAAATPSIAERLAAGRSAFAQGNFPGAVRAARAALATGESADAHQLLGDAFFKLERFADAVREYDAAVALAPGRVQARRARDLASRRLGLAGAAQSTP
jgi:Flp pilus assembly protein TadD